MERKAWTETEDSALKKLVQEIGLSNWTLISMRLCSECDGSSRSGKQCRERWMNHLDKQICKKAWTKNQDKIIFQMHNALGNKWKEISQNLKSRTENDIKNYFYAAMRKGIRRLNRLLGFTKDPAAIRNIKPAVISKVCEEEKILTKGKQNLLGIDDVCKLIQKLSREVDADGHFEQFAENQQLLKASSNFLDKLLQANSQYEQQQKQKKSKNKLKQHDLRQVKSEQMDSEFDISEYLCLGHFSENRPKSQGDPSAKEKEDELCFYPFQDIESVEFNIL